MSARDLLFEIGTEEIPARFMPKALSDLKEYVLEELDSAHIQHSDITVNCTPNRSRTVLNSQKGLSRLRLLMLTEMQPRLPKALPEAAEFQSPNSL